MTLQTAPNSGIPAYRRKPACDAEGAKGQAAGVLFVAPDGDILLLRRSGKEANFAGHWALPGGGVDPGETPDVAADREVGEEMGVKVHGPKKPLDQRRTPNDMVFHTYAQPVAEKFAPKLNSEHSGYVWTPIDDLPEPMHPAVKATLAERVGAAADMSPEDWSGLRDGFVKWTREEEAEPEHAADDLGGNLESYVKWALLDRKRQGADSALRLALDRGTVREKSKDGHLHVSRTPISKATVNPYRGAEIPGAEEMGLELDRVYYLLRSPEELAKAAASFNGKPLLCKHVPVSSEDHASDEVCGSTGTDCVFEDPYLLNSLVVWTQDAIDDIESDEKKELSSGYHYRADMTPGIFRGIRYDGVMRDIVGNHVALVKDGRAGPDVVVGDSMENVMSKPTRIAAVALRTTASMIRPIMALDAKPLDLKPLFAGLSTKNFTARKPAIVTALKGVKLAQDASVEGIVELLNALEGNKAADSDEPAPDAVASAMEAESMVKPEEVSADSDHDKMRGFLKDCGMDDANIETAMSMMPKASAQDESDEEKAAKEAEEKKADGEDEFPDMKDKEKEKGMDKKAMDQAIQSAVTAERRTQQGIRTALDKVRPYVGEMAMAFDSADQVYRKAAELMNIPNAATIHESALPTLIEMQPRAGAQPTVLSHIAMDAAASDDFNKRFPGAGRIGVI